ncbi:MAG: fibrobacter succinogenes major paralogous domain-containing protein [Chitinispirillales bacterium]|jgi:uncharacterized protein (TIGR02145 family)|nr:fibrobacter succinogenes major paralogous domain-containing protein [Chitinispirillales bacterium]
MRVLGRAGLRAVAAAGAVLALSAAGAGAQTADEQKLIKRIPAGYRLHSIDGEKQMFRGDLNGDGADDYALIIKEAAAADESDANRGVMIFFKDGDDYKLALENRQGLGTKGEEDCGNCGYATISFGVGKGNLYIYIYYQKYNAKKTYTFRYKNSEFELIGWDFDMTSINFSAKKKLVKECPKGKKCTETWTAFTMKEPILLRKIVNIHTVDDNSFAGYISEATAETAPTDAGTTGAAATSFTDSRDGKAYKIVKIGNQTWMAENLNYQTKTGAWCYGGDESNCKKYGRLYDWNTAKTACPKGWRLPSIDEWTELVTVAGSSTAGKKLKSKSGWDENGNGTDDYGFSALPGGFRDTDGGFFNVGKYGFWWTASESGGSSAFTRRMAYGEAIVEEYNDDKGDGYSARCVQDANK